VRVRETETGPGPDRHLVRVRRAETGGQGSLGSGLRLWR
jgi:hypothetical protein